METKKNLELQLLSNYLKEIDSIIEECDNLTKVPLADDDFDFDLDFDIDLNLNDDE